MSERVKACPECGSGRVIGRQGNDVECMTCGTLSWGCIRITPEAAKQYQLLYEEKFGHD